MKFTKLLALALVLLMTVAVFAACNGDPAGTDPETTPSQDETTLPQQDETTPAETTADCDHKNALKKTGNEKAATCTEEGYIEYKCNKCDGLDYRTIDMRAHTYGAFKSVDGKYTKKVCSMCQGEVVEDEAGTVVADASAIKFPLFAGFFDGVETIEDAAALFNGFGLTPTMANIVKNDPNGEVYLNIPSGNVSYAPNGCLDLIDEKAALVGKAFTMTFLARYEEAPTEVTAFLTWTVDGKAQVLLSADSQGNYIDANGAKVAKSPHKGWDKFKVEFTAAGGYTIYLNDAQIATGKVATTGATSSIRFFDNKNQFEAYLDEIIITD
jgi:phage FluMu protein Com